MSAALLLPHPPPFAPLTASLCIHLPFSQSAGNHNAMHGKIDAHGYVRVRTPAYNYTTVHARPPRLSARSPTGASRIATALKDTINSVSTCTSAEALSTTSSLTIRVVYTPAAEYFIDQRVMTVSHPQNRGSSGVSGNDSDRASDSSEVWSFCRGCGCQ